MRKKLKFPDLFPILLCLGLFSLILSCSQESSQPSKKSTDSSENESSSNVPRTDVKNDDFKDDKIKNETVEQSGAKPKICTASCESIKDCCPLSIQKWGDCSSYLKTSYCDQNICKVKPCDSKSFCDLNYNQSDFFRGYDCSALGYCLPACKEDLDCCPKSLDRTSPECSKYILSNECNQGFCQSRKCKDNIDCEKRYDETYACDEESKYCFLKCSDNLPCNDGQECVNGFCKVQSCEEKSDCEKLYGDDTYLRGWSCSNLY